MRNKHTILSAKGLHKQYGKRMVVKDVDVSLERGEIVGLLGPNGAGKTTSFYMITGMIKPTKGNICLLYTSPSPRDRQKSRMPSSA